MKYGWPVGTPTSGNLHSIHTWDLNLRKWWITRNLPFRSCFRYLSFHGLFWYPWTHGIDIVCRFSWNGGHTSSVMRNMTNNKFHKYVVNSCRYPTNRLILRYLFLNRAMLLLVPGDMVVADNLTRNQRCVGRLRGGTTCHPNAEVESLNGSVTNQKKGLEPTQNVGLAWL